MTEAKNQESSRGLTKLDPNLVHRVLLTDPSQFHSLTVSGKSHNDKERTTYEDFSKKLDPSFDQSMEGTMKRAYRDRIADMVLTSRDMKPLQELLLELHRAVRSLVPNRTDLHSVLKDEHVRKANMPIEILPLVAMVAEAVILLESQHSSESTKQWLDGAQSDSTRELELNELIAFLVTSILYLMYKVETCQQEKQDFFLGYVLAPRIHSHGIDLERHAFEAKFGKLGEPDIAPLTRQWIAELVSQSKSTELSSSISAREALVKRGWIRNILFREPEQAPLPMPEILSMDFEHLNSIRLVTKSAAAGSALALHAVHASGVSASVLNDQLDFSSPIYLCRQEIAETLVSQHKFASKVKYEETVGRAVVRLAKEWKPSLSADAEAMLMNQSASAVRGEDPVIRLLDSRMKEVFSMLVTWEPSSTNVQMRSGRSSTHESSLPDDSARAFLITSNSEFCQRGLSFYASDLANVSYLAKKIGDLAWKVYGEPLLGKTILDVCQEYS